MKSQGFEGLVVRFSYVRLCYLVLIFSCGRVSCVVRHDTDSIYVRRN